MDVLTDVLNTVRVSAACYGRVELGAPWGFSVHPGEDPKFHVVLEGRCLLELEGQAPVALRAGDLFALPHGDAHVLKDSPATPARPLEELLAHRSDRQEGGRGHGRFNGGGKGNGAGQSNGNGNGNGHGLVTDEAFDADAIAAPCGGGSFGGDGERSTLVCGRLRFEDPRNHPVLRVLPKLVLIRGEHGRTVHWLESTLRFIACESASGRPGAETVINRLADVLFIQIVRGYLASTPTDTRGWLRALTDPQIGAALGLIHETPQQGWTVANLASKVGMSRSTFAGRFAELVGEPPLHYVTRWRMQKAASLLRDGRATLADIADRVGYESEAAFSKAFKRWVGSAPGAYRRAAKTGGAEASL